MGNFSDRFKAIAALPCPKMLNPPTALQLQFIRHPEVGAVDVLAEVTTCFSADERHSALSSELSSNPYHVDVAAWVNSLCDSWDPALKARVLAAIPYDKAKAGALRDYLDQQPDQTQAGVAAFIPLRRKTSAFMPGM